MHFLLTAIGSYGDVHPMVGLGAALARRNHHVSIVANPYFADVVADAGLELLSISTREEYLRMIDHPHLWHPIKAVPFVFQQATAKYLRPLYHLLEQNYLPGETVIGSHALDAASRVFREKVGSPVATVTFAPIAFWSDYQTPQFGPPTIGPHLPKWLNRLQFWIGQRWIVGPVLKRPLDKFRAELGLPKTPELFPNWWFQSDMNLCLFPNWFAPVQPDWPRPIETVGFPLWDGGDSTPLSPEVKAFLAEGDAPIVFTPGTANKQAEGFFATAMEACQRMGRRGILLTKFPEQLPALLPECVRHFDFLPLTRLLPSAAAFVHHGGIGSSSQALAAGVPQLVRPLAFDQFDNSHRLRKLGVAGELRPRQFNVASVAAALQRLTSSKEVAANCQKWASQCKEESALEAACNVMEQLATKS
ncbi:MAG: glycosyltransferase [Aeoliella sp.]